MSIPYSAYFCAGLTILILGSLLGIGLIFRILSITNGQPRQWLRSWWGRGHGVAELARRLHIKEVELQNFRPHYTRITIPKRRGGGVRELLIPDPHTKSMQRCVLRLLLSRLHAHPAAMAFEKSRSIVTNAALHVGQQTVVKLDVKDFFTMTTTDRVERYFKRVGWNAASAHLLTKICTHEGGLPQGAPTSPRLSNLVNYGLDASLAKLARRCRCNYTRYADDITFSMTYRVSRRPGSLVRGLVQSVRRRLKGRGYVMHGKPKLQILRQHQQQKITGLVVNEKIQLPRATRRWLRAVEHHIATGRDATLTPAQLAGWTALRGMIMRQSQPSEAGK